VDAEDAVRLRRVIGRLARQFNAAATDEGLTPSQASVLSVVAARGPISLAELSRVENINPTMLSRVIGFLDRRSLVRREADPADLRAANVAITSGGLRVQTRIMRQRGDMIATSVGALSAADAARIVNALSALEALAEELIRTP
jgi:DNA-binding MarR family transcriptional regulator